MFAAGSGVWIFPHHLSAVGEIPGSVEQPDFRFARRENFKESLEFLSPAANAAPRIIGTAVAGSGVKVYTNPACTILNTSGTAALFGGLGLTTSVSTVLTNFYNGTRPLTSSVPVAFG